MADQKAFKKRLKVLMAKQENLMCADCNEKQPRWASLIKPPPGCPEDLGMGAMMCLECSGSHRRLGVHISFVRSINLDSWKEHEVQIMENGGNKKVNMVFEAHLRRSGAQKPDNTASGQQRERFIRDKYERRKFYDPAAYDEYEEESEEEAPQPARRSAASKPAAAVSRAPSEAAKRRAEARNARLASGPSRQADRPGRINATAKAAPAAAPAVDLLDFSAPPAPADPPAPAPVAPAPMVPSPAPTGANSTIDMFAGMSVSGPAAAPAAPTTSNDSILSLFNTPSQQQQPQANMMMMGQPQMNPMMMQQQQPQQGQMNMMMMQQQQPQQGQMNPMMMQQQQPQQAQMNPMMMQQQQQQMLMMQQQQMQQQQMRMANQGMPSQQHMQPQQMNMQGMQQQQPNMMMMNNQMQQQMNPMMAMQQQPSPTQMNQPMSPQQQQQMMMMQQQQAQRASVTSDGGFGGGAMGSGPSISTIQGQPQKEDPFSEFGFNAFR